MLKTKLHIEGVKDSDTVAGCSGVGNCSHFVQEWLRDFIRESGKDGNARL